jgi:hypothetical protein
MKQMKQKISPKIPLRTLFAPVVYWHLIAEQLCGDIAKNATNVMFLWTKKMKKTLK